MLEQTKKKPNLTPLDLTEEQIDELSEITEDDIIDAQNTFEKSVGTRFLNLLLVETGVST